MDATSFLQRLEQAKTILPPPVLGLVALLLAQEPEAAKSLVRAVPLDDARRVLQVLEKWGLCGWCLHACPSLMEWNPAFSVQIRGAAQRELAACAQRKAALLQLDEVAASQGFVPLLMKGAVTASAFYPSEGIRPSTDIDFMLPAEVIVACFAEQAAAVNSAALGGRRHRHVAPFMLGGYRMELHEYLLSQTRWGQYQDLARASQSLEGYRTLERPAAVDCFTISLLHFSQHVGYFTWDIIDMAHIERHMEFTWTGAAALWRREALTAVVLPPLAVFSAMTGRVPEGLWQELYQGLPMSGRLQVKGALKLLLFSKFTRIRGEWFRTRLSRWPLVATLFRCAAGTPAITALVTGRAEDSRYFWFFHHIGLPLKRSLLFWR